MRRCAVGIFALLLVATPARGEDARIRNLAAVEKSGRISVSFDLSGAFDAPEIRRAIESGLPTVLAYDLELIRKRPNWFDDTVSRARLEVVATYNSVTREYLLNYRRDRRLLRSEIFTSLEELKARMSRIDEQDLFSTEGRKPWKLRVRVRAELLRRYVWYIVPWDVSTPWENTRVESAGRES
jgi:hypothetical protein